MLHLEFFQHASSHVSVNDQAWWQKEKKMREELQEEHIRGC